MVEIQKSRSNIKMKKKYRVKCRYCVSKLYLPCNWVKDGFCGVDAKKCDMVIIGE